MANPTETIDHIKQDTIEPLRKRMISILRQLLGEQVEERDLVFCAMSVIHQCMCFGFHRGKLPPLLRAFEGNSLIDALTEHITIFSLAGIASVKKQLTS